ncbi:hypothetical protein GOV03_01215 [Candidatus Woesearchaeota archaeon]|nr:hypothetical protein [Candidatus Woesearchaeota archaeon]
MLQEIIKSLKTAALVGASVLAFATPVQAEELPTSGAVEVNVGSKRNTLMGRNFSEGYHFEFGIMGKIKFDSKSELKIESRLELDRLNFVDGKGDITTGDLEAKVTLNKHSQFNGGTATIGWGVEVDGYNSKQTYDGVDVTIENITLGLVLISTVDSQYVDFNSSLSAGGGKAGNNVHGTNGAIKTKLKLGLDFDLRDLVGVPLKLGTYGEAKITFLEIKDVNRSDYNLAVGVILNYKIAPDLSAQLGYEHSQHYGNQDNVKGEIVKGGFKIVF